MRNSEYCLASSETLAILDNMNLEDKSKIPNSFIAFLEDMGESNKDKVKFDFNTPLAELPISQKTKEILGFMYITWWCNGDKKEKYKAMIGDYRVKKQELLREKYNPDNMFAKQKDVENIKESQNKTSLVEYRNENIIGKIIRKILNVFKIKK